MKNTLFDALMKKVPRIGIDIDDISERRLLMAWLMAKRFFPEETIEVRYSPSHTGFHLIIHKEVTVLENLLWRAMLRDDAVRIMISLRRFFMNPGEKYIDLLFDDHTGGSAEVLDIQHFLRPFQRKIQKILKNWDNGVDEMVNEIAEENEGKLPTKRTYITSFAFNTVGLKDKIQKICEDIHDGTGERPGDPTFRWKIYQNYSPQSDFVLAIFSASKDQAMQRGMWFLKVKKNKPEVLSEEDIKNIVTFKNKKGNEVYFWVKEKK